MNQNVCVYNISQFNKMSSPILFFIKGYDDYKKLKDKKQKKVKNEKVISFDIGICFRLSYRTPLGYEGSGSKLLMVVYRSDKVDLEIGKGR